MAVATVEPGAVEGKKGAGKPPSGAEQRRRNKAIVNALPPGDEDEITAMRWVISNSQDRTYQHWSMRQWLKEDAKEFRSKLAGLVRAEKLSRSGSASPTPTTSGAGVAESPLTSAGPPRADEGLERLGELLSQELGEWEEYRSRESSRNTGNTAIG